MCGIVAYLGKKPAQSIILDGLKTLEYRGYDSIGIAVVSEKGVSYQKKVGKISELESHLREMIMSGTFGIGHTRWATHGKPSIENAHPHCDCDGKIWLVHNGIIENYVELKEELLLCGHHFLSETDTEVLVHLIEEEYRRIPILEDAVSSALLRIEGAYAVTVIHKDEPRKIVAAKFSSPLRLGIIGDDEFILASDPSAIISHTTNMVTLEDNEMLIIKDDGYKIMHLKKNGEEIKRKIEQIDFSSEELDHNGFSHYMEKEIFSQARSLQETLRGRINLLDGTAVLGGIQSIARELKNIERIHIVGCGSAYCAGLIGDLLFEELAEIPCKTYLASEFRYRAVAGNPKRELLVAVSQSGETADTLAALKEARRHGMLTVGVVNVVGSSIARETHAGVYCRVGPEMAVASTKAFISQVAVLTLLATFLARQRTMTNLIGKMILQELLKIPEAISCILESASQLEMFAKDYSCFLNFAYMGRKYLFPAALEGAIKLKEVSYIHAEAFASGELKHGPIALIEKEFPSLFLVLKDSVYDKNISNIQEVKARGGKIFAIASEHDTTIGKIADNVFYVPQVLECLSPIVAVLPLQLFAYYMARLKGCDVDKPRNLAKSVTVE